MASTNNPNGVKVVYIKRSGISRANDGVGHMGHEVRMWPISSRREGRGNKWVIDRRQPEVLDGSSSALTQNSCVPCLLDSGSTRRPLRGDGSETRSGDHGNLRDTVDAGRVGTIISKHEEVWSDDEGLGGDERTEVLALSRESRNDPRQGQSSSRREDQDMRGVKAEKNPAGLFLPPNIRSWGHFPSGLVQTLHETDDLEAEDDSEREIEWPLTSRADRGAGTSGGNRKKLGGVHKGPPQYEVAAQPVSSVHTCCQEPSMCVESGSGVWALAKGHWEKGLWFVMGKRDNSMPTLAMEKNPAM
ncbi:hypothetical protein EDB87DRAFT_1578148 [Lactarius vividus]|nr:hypothetical protein EDB87DRAFT_1578148 [Lactarius vividus]